MKRVMIILAVSLVLCIPVYAQMGNGMMGGRMMQPEKSRKPGVEGVGSKIFDDECRSCHPNGGNIIVPGLPLIGSRVLANVRTFVAFIRHPQMPDGSEGSMPSFDKSEISDPQAEELYYYIKSADEYGAGGGYGYGMGPGMMGDGMGPGMIGTGPYGQSAECRKFYDDTVKSRKELNDKRFEYFEAVRNPKTTMGTVIGLQKEIRDLQDRIYSEAPLGCW